MGAIGKIVVALLLTVIHSHAVHEPDLGKPSFVRSAVESVPRNDDGLARFSLKSSIGDTFLPLRSAVESAPILTKSQYSSPASIRSFIRDSVEFRPINNRDELKVHPQSNKIITFVRDSVEYRPNNDYVENPEQNLLPTMKVQKANVNNADKYGAFIIPTSYDNSAPAPFRIGSPFQQIVDLKTFESSKRTSEKYQLDRAMPNKNAKMLPKVLCYFTNWGFYRENDGKFVPENLDPSLCSAVIYSFASLDPDRLIIKEFDPWVDIDNDVYKRVTELDVPVLLALGGWTDSTGDKYSRLASDATSRRNFASTLVSFLKRNGFKGLHLDWNYPKCWQSDCQMGPDSDKPNFTKLVREIRDTFDRHDAEFQLGVAISGYKEIITVAYELPELSKIVDYMTVMSYDYHGAWERETGHVSPLYERKGDKYPMYNTDYAMQLLVKSGVDPKKIIMGIPFYGQTFTLEESSKKLVGEGVAADGPGEPGEYTKQPGMLAYYEICMRIRKNKWQVGRDTSMKSGPYAMLLDQWVGFEDVVSVETKAKYVINNGFGGIAAWTVDLDDFQNRCCSESFPLLKSINRALGRLSGDSPKPGSNCARPPAPVTPASPSMTTVGANGVSGGPVHEHTTWPSWNPQTSTSTQPSTWWSPPSTTPKSTTTTKRTTTVSWMQTSTPSSSTWWPTPSTTIRPTSQATRRTTTQKAPTTPRPTTIPVPAVVMPVVSKDPCSPSTFQADSQNCNSFYQCIFGELRQQHCPGGLHWNDATKNCDWPANAKCQAQVKPKPSTIRPQRTTRRTTRTTTPLPTKKTTRKPESVHTRRTTPKPVSAQLGQRPSTCMNGQYYPHKECESYNICVNNRLISRQCPGNLQWNHITQICDWRDNVNCISARTYFRLAQLKVSEDDPCQGNAFIPHPTDCNLYLQCNVDRLIINNCASGLDWNAQMNVCDWPENANCQSTYHPDETHSDIPNYEPSTTTSTTPKPTYPTNRPVLEPLSGYYKVVCYFTNWAWYRKGIARYTPDDINTDLCTHIVYGFAVLDYSELTIRTHDSWADIDNRFYERVAELKSKGVKVSLALGGWNDSQGDKYSRLVRNPTARAKFVKQALQFVEKYGFEGLDLDWEYPVCWQTECKKGFPDEREGFTELVRSLSEAFKPRGLLLSTAVSPSKKIIDAGYNVPALSNLFDWIAVMTYDFHGQWDKKTGHVAPLYYHPEDDYDYFNANFSINYWIEKGAPSRKIVMGMPLYGQSFTLENQAVHGLNAKAPGPGTAGEFTKAAGFLAYYEICDRIKTKGWNVVQDKLGRMGPYAYKGNQWVSFDDKAILKKKSQLVRSLNLGGGMVWALDLDDFKNRCGEGVHPLLTTIHSVLKNSPNEYEPAPYEPETEEMISPEVVPDNIETTDQDNDYNEHNEIEEIDNVNETHEQMVENAGDNDNLVEPEIDVGYDVQSEVGLTNDFKVVCYFTNWAWYRQGGGKFLPEDIDPDLCTHIVYGFAVLNRDSLTIKPHDSWADIDNKFYERVIAFKAKGIKVTVAIGGWNDSAGDKYSRLVLDPAARARFVNHVMEFIIKYNFDGLDLDWEYPVCWQVDCTKGSPLEKDGFSALVQDLSIAFKPEGLLLSSAVSPNKKVIDAGYDVPKLSKYFDWIAVMTYDFHGQWDKKTGHVAPMYDHPDDDRTFNSNFSINYWLEQGADRKKIIMGMPMYGQSFSLAETTKNILNSPTYGGGEAGEATRARGFLSYYEICRNIKEKQWQVVRDARGRMGPYAYKRDQWVSFDDISMIEHKSEYVKAMDLGGAMIWALDLDDFKNICDCETYPLLKTINRVLRNYPPLHKTCKLEENTEIAPEGNFNTTPSPVASSTWWPTSAPSATNQKGTQKPVTDVDENEYEDISGNDEIDFISCQGRNFMAHNSDCNKYYVCQHEKWMERRCPEGLHWNENHCDWPVNSDCQVITDQRTTTTENSLTTKKPKPEIVDNDKSTKKPITITTKKPTQRPKPPSSKPPPPNDKFKVVCYFTNWAWYRQGDGKYTPDDIEDSLCTHIVYGFAVLGGETLTLRTHDSWADIDNRFYERVVEYKNKGIRVTLAIGGWNDSLGDKYSRLVRNPVARAKFVKHAIEFLEKYGFEGLDLDWEYPVCWQVDCDKGISDEKEGFAALVRELSEEFTPRGLLLSAAVSPSKKVIDTGYDVPTLARYFDWIAVMTYDFHGHWDKKTGHVAPLYYVEGDDYDYFNGNFSINYWIEKGAPAEKIVMGMPLYGQSFSLADSTKRGLNSQSRGPGQAGKFTRAAGFLAYYEICENVNNGGWTVVRDNDGRIGPYAYSGNQWVSYDDVEEIRRKSEFVKRMGLGGGMVWALDLDDFRGRCGCGKHPLLRTLSQELRGATGQRAINCT